MNDALPKPSIVCRILLLAMSLFLGYLIFEAFRSSNPPHLLTKEIIITSALLLALVFSESFHSISIGSFLILKKDIKRAEQEKAEAKKELNEIRISYANLAAQISQNQSQRLSTYNITGISPSDLRRELGIVDAPFEEKANNKEEAVSERVRDQDAQPTTTNTSTDYQTRHKITQTLEEDLFQRFCKKFDIPQLDIRRDITFDSSFHFVDPIMSRASVYDGYIKQDKKEYFVEAVPRLDRMSPMFRDRLFVMLARILFYRQAKRLMLSWFC